MATRYSDSVVMDGLMGPNAPMPKPPSPASGIAEILFDIGGILASDPRNQRTDLALIFYQLATALKPDQDFAWLMIAGLYEQFQQIPKAVAALGRIGPTSPLYWQARLRTAALDAQEDKFDQAVARLRTLVAEKPDRIDAALTLADLLRSKDRFAEAVAAYDTAISRLGTPDERHWQVYFGRGIVLERTKQVAEGRGRHEEGARTLARAALRAELSRLQLDRPGPASRGRHEDAGAATELRPDDGAITDSVGWAYYRLGQYEKAVEWLERATEQKGDDSTITDHLGDAYWHVGRRARRASSGSARCTRSRTRIVMPIIEDKIANGLNSVERQADRLREGRRHQAGRLIRRAEGRVRLARAKVNLWLNVVGRRADGYHLLDSLVAFTDLADGIEVVPASGLSLEIVGPGAAALAGEDASDNLVLKAARLLAGRAGVAPRAALRLTKRIPVAAGLGGGSADAAATLRALVDLWRVAMPEEELFDLAASLGADVPMCLAGRPAVASGIGERLAPAPPVAGLRHPAGQSRCRVADARRLPRSPRRFCPGPSR